MIAEVAIAAIHPPYDSFLEQWGSALANSLVAIGVAIEIKFGHMAGLRQDELRRRSDEKAVEANARAAEANQKAVEAQLELARFKAPRRPTPEQLASITEKLKRFALTFFDSGMAANSGEQADFWWLLQPALIEAGWIHVPWNTWGMLLTQGANRPASGSVAATNVEIHLHPENRGKLERAATALVSALNANGIEAKDAGFNAHSPNAMAVHILIGEKR